MLIDWFTVIAQVVNFLVLVWLLKRFLYHPILNAIDAREKRISDELADADNKRTEAEQQREKYEQKNDEFEKLRMANMNKVAAEAKAESVRLLDSVRADSEALRIQLESALKNEQLSLQQALGEEVRNEVFEIARKVLRDLSETSLEVSMVGVFLKRLVALNDDEKARLHSAFKDSGQPIIVHTAFDLPSEQYELIKAALSDILGTSANVEFVTDPTVISGIEINANGQKIAWSIADYLSALTKRVDQVLQSKQVLQSNEKEQTL